MVQLVKTPMGFFVVAMKDQVSEFRELPSDPRTAAEELEQFPEWEAEMRTKAYDVEEDEERGLDPMKVVSLIGVPENEYLTVARQVGIQVARRQIKEHMGRDLLIVQTIGAVDDLTKTVNLLINRLVEWYGLHFPELKVHEDQEKYLKLLLKHRREESMGLELKTRDLDIIRDYATGVQELLTRRKALEAYLESAMIELAPNLHALAGANLGARLIAHAGSLKDLAMLPGSTIQVLGAEKALFQHLRKGTPPPKHGVIFQHPEISGSPRNQRGKLARTLAAKLALAARADHFSGEIKPCIMEDWKARLVEVKEGKQDEKTEG